MFSSIYNWFLNTFVRVDPRIKSIIFFVLMLVVLWGLYMGFKKSNARGGDKMKDWGISYFVTSAISIILVVLIFIL